MDDMGLQSVINRVFQTCPAGFQPQIALGNLVKQALLWLPGNKTASRERVEYWLSNPLLGCMGTTNRAYRDPYGLQHAQECVVCWAGLDIDADDNPALTTAQMAERVRSVCPKASIRTSFSGRGLHVVHVLDHPQAMPTLWASPYTRSVNRSFVAALADAGIRVCKSDSRVFWFCGGENAWLHQSEAKIPAPPVPKDLAALSRREKRETPEPGVSCSGEHVATDCVRRWVQRFAAAGIRVVPGHQNPVNVGAAADVIRAHGGVIRSKSPMTTRRGVNGYLDCSYSQISLWTYADGHTVWSDSDADELIDSMLSVD